MGDEEIQSVAKQAEAHYDWLKDQVHLQYDEIQELKEENKRLNNIINEFETLIKHEITESIFEDNYGRVDSLEYCLATLKELKDGGKE